MQPLRIALAQLAPELGQLDANLARHHELLVEARAAGAGLIVFPELGLTGYHLQDLAAEVAMTVDDPRLLALAAETGGCSAVVSFVEESSDHRLFIAAALLEDGAVRHVQRKLYLPTYGLFDERRFFAAGDALRATPSRLGVGVGLAICEDFWHLGVPELLALDGAQVLVNVASSPGRDVAAVNAGGLGTAVSWRTLLRTYAQLTTSVVVFCNRVGVDESVSFWGGSMVLGPDRGRDRRGAALRGGARPRRRGACRHPARADRPPAPARRAARAHGAGARADRGRAGRDRRGRHRGVAGAMRAPA